MTKLTKRGGKAKMKVRLTFHKPRPLQPWGNGEHQMELSTYRRAGVHHSHETRGTHKTDKK